MNDNASIKAVPGHSVLCARPPNGARVTRSFGSGRRAAQPSFERHRACRAVTPL